VNKIVSDSPDWNPSRVWRSADAVMQTRKDLNWKMEGMPFTMPPDSSGGMTPFYEIKEIPYQPQVINYTDSTTVASLAGKDIEEQEMKIYINDMSLPSGGDFRIGNNLLYEDINSGHSSHDRGEDVDVSVNQLINNCKGKEMRDMAIKLEKILEAVFGKDKIWYEGKDHWHCTISNKSFNKRKYRDETK